MGAYGPPQLSITLPFVLLLATAFALGAGIGLVAGGGRRSAWLGLVLALATMPLPLLAPVEQPIARFVLGLASVLALVRAVDFLRGTKLQTPLRRVWFALTPFDIRQTSPVAPGLDRAHLASLAGYATLCGAALLSIVHLVPRAPAPLGVPLRWLLGLAFLYGAIDAVVALLHVGYRLAGVALPDFHRTPIVSRSLQEFWGVRWNRPVHEWLARHCFAPLARRRHPLAGVAAAFVASTLIHVWLTFVCVSLRLTAAMGAFFLLHGALVLAERRIGVARWRPAAGRTWTVLCFALTGPLFAESILHTLAL